MPTRQLAVRRAGAPDEPDLRRLLRENPMAGAVSLALEREPDFFLSAAVEGDRHDAFVAREPGGRAVGLFSRSSREVWVNGAPARAGYLGALRIAAGYRRRRRLLAEGFEAVRAARRPDELPFDLTSIVSDNAPARRLLAGGLPGVPEYRELGELVTLAFAVRAGVRGWRAGVAGAIAGRPAREAARLRAGAEVRAADASLWPEIAACLARHHARYQLAPRLGADELACPARSRGLSASDFTVALRGGRVAAAVARWDQRSFKQAVVRGYARPLAAARPLLNLLRPVGGWPRLPPVGQPLPAVFLSHLAVDDDDPALLDAVLDGALGEAAAAPGPAPLFLLGLSSRHPLLAAARRRPHRAYRSTLYAVAWPGAAAALAALDGRPVHVEVATL